MKQKKYHDDRQSYYVNWEQVEADSIDEAVKLRLTASAKREYGRSALCISVKPNGRRGDNLYYEGLIVRPSCGSFAVLENNVQAVVQPLPD